MAWKGFLCTALATFCVFCIEAHSTPILVINLKIQQQQNPSAHQKAQTDMKNDGCTGWPTLATRMWEHLGPYYNL